MDKYLSAGAAGPARDRRLPCRQPRAHVLGVISPARARDSTSSRTDTTPRKRNRRTADDAPHPFDAARRRRISGVRYCTMILPVIPGWSFGALVRERARRIELAHDRGIRVGACDVRGPSGNGVERDIVAEGGEHETHGRPDAHGERRRVERLTGRRVHRVRRRGRTSARAARVTRAAVPGGARRRRCGAALAACCGARERHRDPEVLSCAFAETCCQGGEHVGELVYVCTICSLFGWHCPAFTALLQGPGQTSHAGRREPEPRTSSGTAWRAW